MCRVLAVLLEAKIRDLAENVTVTALRSQPEQLLPANIPPAFQTLAPVLSNMDPAGAECTVIISSILQGLAVGFGQAVRSIGVRQGFTVNETQVVYTEAKAMFGPLKPSITIHDAR